MEKLRYTDEQFEKIRRGEGFAQLAQLYAEVFADEPWNESTKSPSCGRYFGKYSKIGDPCPNCGDELAEAYPLNETASYIENALNRKGSVLTTLEDDGKIIGFAWGFICENPEELVREKYKTSEMQDGLMEAFKRLRMSSSFFYFSECGISSPYRGQGLSNLLAEDMVVRAGELEQSLVMRTSFKSPMVSVAEKFKMLQIMGPLGDLIINLMDTENLDRVMYVKKF